MNNQQLDLDGIEARANAATPGPWCTDSWEIYQGSEYEAGAEWIGETCRGRVEGLAQDRADAAFVAAARTDVPALLAEVRRLRAELAAETRLHSGTIDDRDRAQDMADKLAYAVAPEEVIGEHSSMNCPWENALDLITPMAEVDKLRQQVAAVADLCDAAEKQATRWEQPLPVPEWVTAVRRAVEQPAASEEQR